MISIAERKSTPLEKTPPSQISLNEPQQRHDYDALNERKNNEEPTSPKPLDEKDREIEREAKKKIDI
jgi:hypothetical protein